MQFSPTTLAILKNFATIHDHILVQPGNQLCTLARGAVLAKATVAECFPVEFGIYDLDNFLSVISLFNVADVDFEDRCIRIRDVGGDAQVRYLYAAPSYVNGRVPKLLPTPKERIEFDLTEDTWLAFQKAATVLGKKEVRVFSDGESISMTTYDHKYPNGHEFSTAILDSPHGRRCNTIHLIENVKLLKGSYRVTVTPDYTVFKNTSGFDLTYWIGCDPSSTFE